MNPEIESDHELDQTISQLDFDNLEVTDEVGEESSEEVIEIKRDEKKIDDLQSGSEEKRNVEISKKIEESELRKERKEIKESVESAEEDVWVKTVRYAGERKSEKNRSEGETEEERVLTEQLERFKRKRKEDEEAETKVAKQLFRIREKAREAARDIELQKKKEEDERKKKFKPEEKARQAYQEVQRMLEESERLLTEASDVRVALAEASKKALFHFNNTTQHNNNLSSIASALKKEWSDRKSERVRQENTEKNLASKAQDEAKK